MANKSKIPGFSVFVLDGKEISGKQAQELSSQQKEKVKWKLNGPHHEAKWARHLTEKIVESSFVRAGKVFIRFVVIIPQAEHEKL